MTISTLQAAGFGLDPGTWLFVERYTIVGPNSFTLETGYLQKNGSYKTILKETVTVPSVYYSLQNYEEIKTFSGKPVMMDFYFDAHKNAGVLPNWVRSKHEYPFLGYHYVTISVGRFSDATGPVLTITEPKNGDRLESLGCQIKGTASDPSGVYEVRVNLNNEGWYGTISENEWQTFASLKMGKNTIQVYAEDYLGNRSATKTLTVTRFAGSDFSLTIFGKGTVTPLKDDQRLDVGEVYTVRAFPSPGYAFTGWNAYGFTTSTNSSKNPFSFRMPEWYFSLYASFADVAKPSVSVLQPNPNQRVLTPALNIIGTAKDNGFLASVSVQLNEGSWVVTTGTSNWAKNVTLIPGVNRIRYYAADAAGNRSTTNSVSVTYVKTHPFSLAINGAGSSSPNLHGKALEVGKVYSTTAVPRAGWRFQRWDGSFAGTSSTLKFTMPDGAVNEISYFADVATPTVSVTTPKVKQMMTKSFNISGKAADNHSVSEVQYRIDSGSWQQASGTTNWSAHAQLLAGPHTLQVYAQDSYGNRSKTNSVGFSVVETAGFPLAGFSSSTDGDAQTLAVPVIFEVNQVDGRFGFVFSTEVGKTYRVQGSEDLINWRDLVSGFIAESDEYQFVDSQTSEVFRFYRVVGE